MVTEREQGVEIGWVGAACMLLLLTRWLCRFYREITDAGRGVRPPVRTRRPRDQLQARLSCRYRHALAMSRPCSDHDIHRSGSPRPIAVTCARSQVHVLSGDVTALSHVPHRFSFSTQEFLCINPSRYDFMRKLLKVSQIRRLSNNIADPLHSAPCMIMTQRFLRERNSVTS
jgi:hypothetical protein